MFTIGENMEHTIHLGIGGWIALVLFAWGLVYELRRTYFQLQIRKYHTAGISLLGIGLAALTVPGLSSSLLSIVSITLMSSILFITVHHTGIFLRHRNPTKFAWHHLSRIHTNSTSTNPNK